ncbi:hypothetical protein HKX48_002626, partial [Thoreauomyces humboldtii]
NAEPEDHLTISIVSSNEAARTTAASSVVPVVTRPSIDLPLNVRERQQQSQHPSSVVQRPVCARFFRSGSRQFHVVDDASELPPPGCDAMAKSDGDDGSDTEFCVMGSPAHVAALKQKVQELQQTAMDAAAEREMARQRAEAIGDELESHKADLLHLQRTMTGMTGSSSATVGGSQLHVTVKKYGPGAIETMDSDSVRSDSDDTVWRQTFWRKPRIRQYLVNHATLVREAEERSTTWLELLFDLLFAGIVGILGAAYIGTTLPLDLVQYSVLFLMVIRPWEDFLMYHNVFASDDVAQKFFVLWIMALVVGLGINCTNAIGSTHTIFLVFYLLLRFSFAFTYLSFLPLFPKFRHSLIGSALPVFVSAPLFVSSIFVARSHSLTLWWTGVAIDTLLTPMVILLTRYVRWLPRPTHRLAVSIEHLSDRNGAFLIIVLGEVTVALFYNSENSAPDVLYVKAVLALILALNLAWIYFDVDGGVQEIHALRRHAYTGITWNLCHIPLFGSIVLAGVSVEQIVRATDEGNTTSSEEVEHHFTVQTYQTFFGALSLTLACLTLISLTHRSLHASRVPKRYRTAARMVVSICFAGLAGAVRDDGGEGAVPLMSSS